MTNSQEITPREAFKKIFPKFAKGLENEKNV